MNRNTEKWEYDFITIDKFWSKKFPKEEFINEINKKGSEGWELISTSTPTNSYILLAVFKRRIPN